MTEFIGKKLNGYRMLETVGVDGISSFYRATSPDKKELVVVRVFPSELGRNRQILERMRESFHALNRINHPSIPPVQGFSVIDGYPYVVMPFTAAGSLRDRIEFGALAATNAEVVLKQMASALNEAHSKGLVHGNLNPSQIHFDESGKVQIIGFGETSILSDFFHGEQIIEEGVFDYRAPEVVAGGKITPASDQYSLGLIALQLLTRLPVDEALGRLEYHLENGNGFRTRPNNLALALPTRVIDVLSRALSNKPSDRFPSIKAMIQSLEAAMWKEDPPPERKPVQSVKEKAGTEKQTHKRVLIFVISIAIVLCLFAIEPALTMRGDLKLGDLLSFAKLGASTESAEENSAKGGTVELGIFPTKVPEETAIVIGATGTQLTSESPTEGTEEGEAEASSTPTPQVVTSATPSPIPTQIVPATSTRVFTATPTEPQPTPTSTRTSTPTVPPPSSEPTIDPDRCSSYQGSDRYCTPTPEPTIPPGQCSRYHRSDNYCTPVPGATIPPDWCSEYSGSDWFCTQTPEPTIPPDQCSRDYHDDNFCTRTPEP